MMQNWGKSSKWRNEKFSNLLRTSVMDFHFHNLAIGFSATFAPCHPKLEDNSSCDFKELSGTGMLYRYVWYMHSSLSWLVGASRTNWVESTISFPPCYFIYSWNDPPSQICQHVLLSSNVLRIYRFPPHAAHISFWLLQENVE